MDRITSIAALQQVLTTARLAGRRVGLVPTMGALHEGHATLIRRAASETDFVVTTIFVNPLQFGVNEDLSSYPRDLDGDHHIATAAGAAVLFCPTVDEMYPFGPTNVLTNVRVRGISELMEGSHRPGHFDGVATVVAKLFALTGTCSAYFGEKDYQQLAIIRRLASDLSFPVTIIGVPTIREPNGLAMSSRNRYLTPDEFDGASIIFRSLTAGRTALDHGDENFESIRNNIERTIAASPVVSGVDYVAIVDASTLTAPSRERDTRILVACRVGRARLIDNM
jgi:pantoate--beta-alanine ligase